MLSVPETVSPSFLFSLITPYNKDWLLLNIGLIANVNQTMPSEAWSLAQLGRRIVTLGFIPGHYILIMFLASFISQIKSGESNFL